MLPTVSRGSMSAVRKYFCYSLPPQTNRSRSRYKCVMVSIHATLHGAVVTTAQQGVRMASTHTNSGTHCLSCQHLTQGTGQHEKHRGNKRIYIYIYVWIGTRGLGGHHKLGPQCAACRFCLDPHRAHKEKCHQRDCPGAQKMHPRLKMDFIWDARLRQTNKWGGHSKAERVGLPSGAGGPRGWAGLVSGGPAVLPTGVRTVVCQVGRAGQLSGAGGLAKWGGGARKAY